MDLKKDERIVMTLDAGGTNFVFSAIQGGEEIIDPFSVQAKYDTLEEVLYAIINGFRQTELRIPGTASAISFCFPGPAEYEAGIIGDLANLPTFRGGVALGPMLEDTFHIPVYINNDGDLFTYGEAIEGLLPEINTLLKEHNSPKHYNNLFGATFGTGFGGGIVCNGDIFLGDNSASGEINRLRNKLHPSYSVEESISIRGVKRVYAGEMGITIDECPEPKEIYEIAMGHKEGNRAAANIAFHEMAEVAGSALADAISLIDGIIVIGGGLSGAHPVFLDKLVEEMNSHFSTPEGTMLERMEVKAYNLENPKQLKAFLHGAAREITVPLSNRKISYDPIKRIGVATTRLGTAKAVSIGAYAYAIHQLDK